MGTSLLLEPIMIVGRDGLDSWVFFYLVVKNGSKLGVKPQDVSEYCWSRMDSYAKSVYLKYCEKTENPAFLKISNKFLKYLFWLGGIYVKSTAYGDILEEERGISYINVYMKIDIEVFREVASKDVFNNRKIENEDNIFMNLENGCLYEISDWKSDLIRVEWLDADNFVLYWRFINKEINHSGLVSELMNKYSLASSESGYELETSNDKDELDGGDGYYEIKTSESDKLTSLQYKAMTAKEIDTYGETVYKLRNEEFSLLSGRDEHVIADARLDALRYFGVEFRKKYNIPLRFGFRTLSSVKS